MEEQGTHKPLVGSSNLALATFLFNVIYPHLLMIMITNSFPVPVCRFPQARGCKEFKDKVAFRCEEVDHQTYYCFHAHLRLSWSVIKTDLRLTPFEGKTYGVR